MPRGACRPYGHEQRQGKAWYSLRKRGNKVDSAMSPNCHSFSFSISVFKDMGLDEKWHIHGTVAAPVSSRHHEALMVLIY